MKRSLDRATARNVLEQCKDGRNDRYGRPGTARAGGCRRAGGGVGFAGGRHGLPRDHSGSEHCAAAVGAGRATAAGDATLQALNSDHPVVIALLAYLYTASGQYPQGVRYAEQTIANGVGAGPVAANYANGSVNDPSLRPKAPFFVQEAVNAGWQVDPFSIAHQLNAQGEPDAAFAVLAAARAPTPDRARQQWMEILAEAEASRGRSTTA
jgi:hypothetical protein